MLQATTEEPVSPVTLSGDWSRVARLLLVTTLSVAGSIGNVFMISAIMIEDHLRKRGNSFLVNLALADMLITGLVMPATAIALLANIGDVDNRICTAQWGLALVSCLVTLLSLAAAAVENYARLYLPLCHALLSPCRIGTCVLLIWTAACAVVAVQLVFNLGPDYCELTSQGLLPYQIFMGVVFVVVPTVTTVFCYTILMIRLRSSRPAVRAYRTQDAFCADYSVITTNMCGFLVFVIFWLPFGVTLILAPAPTISRRLFYNLAWFALSKSCVNNLVYCVTNRHFRSAYVNLFHYCCCKTTVSFSRRSREVIRPPGDVRVHIIPAYNMNYSSPMRRETAKAANKPYEI